MKVLVCGSRGWLRVTDIGRRLSKLPQDSTIIHGGAEGPDTYAALYAGLRGLSVMKFEPDWKRHGRKAGILRNLEMLDQAPDLVLAFWDGKSPGTKHTITEAKRRGIPVEVFAP